MRIRILLIAIIMITHPASAYFDSGNDAYRLCKDTGYFSQGHCLGYWAGIWDAFSQLNFFCGTAHATKQQIADIVIKYMVQHPEERHKPAISLGLAALTEAFPCNNRKNQ